MASASQADFGGSDSRHLLQQKNHPKGGFSVGAVLCIVPAVRARSFATTPRRGLLLTGNNRLLSNTPVSGGFLFIAGIFLF